MLKTITHESGALDIRIVLIDDHELFLAGLLALIQDEPGLTVVGQALNRAQAFEVARTKPDIIVLDLLLGSDNSLEFLSELIEAVQGPPEQLNSSVELLMRSRAKPLSGA